MVTRLWRCGLLLILLAGCGTAATNELTVTPPATLTPAAQPTQPPATTGGNPTAQSTPTAASDSAPTSMPASPTVIADGPAIPAFARALTVESPRLEGEDVRLLQEALLRLGYSEVGAADGLYGPNTSRAVNLFQAANGLAATGVVDEQTWNLIWSPAALGVDDGIGPDRVSGLLFYLDSDGQTIKTIRPDGTDGQTLLKIEKDEDRAVVDLSADPTGTYVLYGLAGGDGRYGTDYYLVENGAPTYLASFSDAPRWSPDGGRIVGAAIDPNVAQVVGMLTVYDIAGGTSTPLEIEGRASWSPDGTWLVYTNGQNVFRYDLATGAIEKLSDLPLEQEWYVQEAHVWPDGTQISFYAARRENTGASGNGMQWWIMPIGGGAAEELTPPGGNGAGHATMNPLGGVMAYNEGAHVSACISQQGVYLLSQVPGAALTSPVITDITFDDRNSTYVLGLWWSPLGTRLALSLQPYFCDFEAGLKLETPRIYLWDGAATSEVQFLVEGSYPVWVMNP